MWEWLLYSLNKSAIYIMLLMQAFNEFGQKKIKKKCCTFLNLFSFQLDHEVGCGSMILHLCWILTLFPYHWGSPRLLGFSLPFEVALIQVAPLDLQWLSPGKGERFPLDLADAQAAQNFCWIQHRNISLPVPVDVRTVLNNTFKSHWHQRKN